MVKSMTTEDLPGDVVEMSIDEVQTGMAAVTHDIVRTAFRTGDEDTIRALCLYINPNAPQD